VVSNNIVCCVFIFFVFALCTICSHFLRIVHFWLPLRYSLKFTYCNLGLQWFLSVIQPHLIWEWTDRNYMCIQTMLQYWYGFIEEYLFERLKFYVIYKRINHFLHFKCLYYGKT
jgi:hypothetical protein